MEESDFYSGEELRGEREQRGRGREKEQERARDESAGEMKRTEALDIQQ